MSTPYPEISIWVVPESARRATLEGVRPTGRRGRESGAFWIGVRSEVSTITAVILPHGRGVEEHAGQWKVSPEVFGTISRWVKPRGMSLLGIAHTHMPGVPARLSWADRHQSVRAPGVLAVVIGNAGEEEDHAQWGWYVFEVEDFRQLAGLELARRIRQGSEGVEVWRADIEGVWPVPEPAAR